VKNENNVTQDLQNELTEIRQEAMMSDAQRKKKLMMWGVRNLLSAGLVWYFWEATWMKYALWIIIPLSFLSLRIILLYIQLASRRLEKAQGKIDNIEETIQNAREED